ncbi:hypothetical protein NGM37_47800, partial [Streptomyces sp. TRM76130]|nr:hypothetical protein [Streptomyces sp. TRM76130]
VSADGGFRVGALTGSWSKRTAVYVGEGAREAARRARITALREELAAHADAMARLDAERATVARRREALDAELTGLPDDAALRHAHALAAAASDAAHRARRRRDERAA